MSKILTVFYSLKGETIAPGMKIVNLEKGYTNIAAEYIQKAVGGDLFEIETIKEYNPDHMKMIYEAKEELEQGVRPQIKGLPSDFDSYDTVFLGFPNWWNTLPMPVVTFIEAVNWQGKKIIPFVTSGGSGEGNSGADLAKYAQGAEISTFGEFLGHEVPDSEEKIAAWAKSKI